VAAVKKVVDHEDQVPLAGAAAKSGGTEPKSNPVDIEKAA